MPEKTALERSRRELFEAIERHFDEFLAAFSKAGSNAITWDEGRKRWTVRVNERARQKIQSLSTFFSSESIDKALDKFARAVEEETTKKLEARGRSIRVRD